MSNLEPDMECDVSGCFCEASPGIRVCPSHFQEFDYYWAREGIPGMEASPAHFEIWLELKKQEILG